MQIPASDPVHGSGPVKPQTTSTKSIESGPFQVREHNPDLTAGSTEKHVRVIFLAPPTFGETSGSIYVAQVPGSGLRIKLLHDYPDMKPQVGWRIDVDGKIHEIKSIVDGVFVCDLLAGEAPLPDVLPHEKW